MHQQRTLATPKKTRCALSQSQELNVSQTPLQWKNIAVVAHSGVGQDSVLATTAAYKSSESFARRAQASLQSLRELCVWQILQSRGWLFRAARNFVLAFCAQVPCRARRQGRSLAWRVCGNPARPLCSKSRALWLRVARCPDTCWRHTAPTLNPCTCLQQGNETTS